MAVIFGLLTALSNALAVTMQHIASTSETKRSSWWRLILYLLRHPLWLLGWLALLGSLVFQALALHFGPLSVVQPLLVTELIMALALRRLWLRQTIRFASWVAAAVTALGLIAFLVATSPTESAYSPVAHEWVVASGLCLGAVVVLIALAQRGSPSRRAGLFGAATAVAWAIEATFIKATTDTISAYGVGAIFEHWPLYALVVGGAIGLFCEQSALHVGPLAVSQPFIVIVDPIVSVILGVWLYHEKRQVGAAHVTIGAVGFAVMCVGIVAMTQTAPPSLSADVRRI